jgi:DNA-binding GntR family transcriptional regulator
MTALPGFATRADAVAEQLRQLILSGEYPAGMRVRQADVARRYGISTTPVREAFVALAREGFLVPDPHKGMTVRRPSLREMDDLYEIRIALEPLATARAAEVITDDDVAGLDEILHEMRAVATQSGPEAEARHAALNTRFHERIYEVADRPRLAELITQMRLQSGVYVRMFPIEFVAMGTSDEQHGAIVEALRTRSPKRAERAMRDHLRFNADHIAEQLRATSEQHGGDADVGARRSRNPVA